MGNTWQGNSRAAKELGHMVEIYAIYNWNVILRRFYSFKSSMYAEPWKSWLTKQADVRPTDVLLTVTQSLWRMYLTFHWGAASGMTPLHTQAVECGGYQTEFNFIHLLNEISSQALSTQV